MRSLDQTLVGVRPISGPVKRPREKVGEVEGRGRADRLASLSSFPRVVAGRWRYPWYLRGERLNCRTGHVWVSGAWDNCSGLYVEAVKRRKEIPLASSVQ